MQNAIRHILLLLTLSGLSLPLCLAQFQSLRFDRLTMEDGLPNPSVLDIIQDRQGFLWIGTLSGIVRYDGHEMKTYLLSANMKDSLPTRNIPNFYEDKSGNLWVGFQYPEVSPKLYRYDVSLDYFKPCLFDAGRKENPIGTGISCMREDRHGRLLVGTWGDGLYAIDIGKEKDGIASKDLPFRHFLHIPEDSSSLGNNVVAKGWSEDDEGNFWLPTDDGLCKFTPGQDKFKTFRFTTDTVPMANEFGVTFFEKPATLWVGSFLHGLLVFDVKKEKFTKQYRHDPQNPFSISPDAVWKIIKAQDGKFWIGVNGRMDIFDPDAETFTHVKDESQETWEENFPWNNALVEDYSGNIWTAVWQHGIYKFNPGKGRFHFLRPDAKKLPGVKSWWAQCEDNDGNIWFSTDGEGIVRWNRKTNSYRHFRHYPGNPNSLSGNQVESISLAPDGYLWIGSDGGLDKMDANGRVVKHYQPYKKGGDIEFCHFDKNGTLWTAAFEDEPGFCGLTDPEKGTFKCYSNKMENLGGISGLVTIEEDEQGRLWLGVNQWGFYIFDPKTEQFEHLAKEYGVHDIHFDRFGNCWLATHSEGLKMFDRQTKQVVHVSKAEHEKIGIPRGILEDAHGFLWMKTPDGVVQFDPRSRKVLRQFSRLNWMEKEAQWYSGEGFKTRSGEFFFNSPSGVLHFHPDSLAIDSFPPKVALTEFRLLNETVQPGGESPLKVDISHTKAIELAHWQNDFTLVFAALHFKSPTENTYQYRLENYDPDWRSVGTDRSANFTNLNPGSYIFRVRAANSDGVWGESIALQINIRSPWWATWWAYILYALTAGSLLFGIRRYELRRKLAKAEAHRLAELDAVKSRLYTNITHEFRTPLTVILGLAEEGELEIGKLEKLEIGKLEGKPISQFPISQFPISIFSAIRRNGRQLLNLVNQMLDLSKLESGAMKLNMVQGDVVNYLHYLAESFHSLAKSKDVRLVFQSEMPELVMDYEPQRLQQVVSNLLSNAFKFTPAGGEVVVKLEIGKLEIGKLGGSPISNFPISNSPISQFLISISDTGIGIPEEKLPFVFDRFFQVESADSTSSAVSTGGTGIGLALAKELVKLMNGDISVSSKAGGGAEFTVALPITQTAEKQALAADFSAQVLPEAAFSEIGEAVFPMPVSPKTDPGAPLLLLIEDNADVVKYLLTCLPDYRIEVAQDGEEGIEKATDLVPDLILSDVMMPKKDGFEVCQILKNDERTSHVPIILLTAKADVESKLEGLERGADAYLPKPFHKEELLVRIRKLLELRQKLQTHYFALATGSQGADLAAPAILAAPAAALEDAFVLKLRGIIESHLDDAGFSVEQLCREAAMSRANLFRKLKALTGQSANDLVRSIRLAKAKKLLKEDPSLTIAAVAYDTGFSDPDYFAKVFKEEVGRTPSEWRKG